MDGQSGVILYLMLHMNYQLLTMTYLMALLHLLVNNLWIINRSSKGPYYFKASIPYQGHKCPNMIMCTVLDYCSLEGPPNCYILCWAKNIFIHKTESPRPIHFKHSHWRNRWSRSKLASHYAWGTNGVCECKMDVKSTWIPTWHQMDHVSWSLGLFSKTTSWR